MPPLSSLQLEEYLKKNQVDLETLTLDEFKTWLDERIKDASKQEMFRQRLLIRDLVHDNKRALTYRKNKLRVAEEAYNASSEAAEIEALKGQLDSFSKAVEGLTAAVAKKDASSKKLAEFQKKLADTSARYESLTNGSEVAKRLASAQASYQKFRVEIGLDQAETKLEQLGKERGHQSSSSGDRYEEVSRRETLEFIVPSVARAGQVCEVLNGATLGCARGELDQVVVTKRVGTELYDVLAVIEAKRNINDVAHGFRMRQENLAWFCGLEGGYDPALYRTELFPDGRFKKTVSHQQDGKVFQFDQKSFDLFKRASPTQPHLERLFFVTEPRRLVGCTADEIGRILYIVSTDATFEMSKEKSVKAFWKRVKEMVEPMQSRDVLEMYLKAGLAGNIFFARM